MLSPEFWCAAQLDTVCALSQAIGPANLAIFVPLLQKLAMRHKVHSEAFSRLAQQLLAHDPPCMSNAPDWESAHGWLNSLAPPPKPETLSSSLPEAPSAPFLPRSCTANRVCTWRFFCYCACCGDGQGM